MAHPWCGTDAIQQKLKEENPGFVEHMHKSMSKVAQRQRDAQGAQKLTLIVPVVIHVIHDNGHPQSLAVVQNMIEQRRLSRSQKAREHGDGQLLWS